MPCLLNNLLMTFVINKRSKEHSFMYMYHLKLNLMHQNHFSKHFRAIIIEFGIKIMLTFSIFQKWYLNWYIL